MARLLCFREPVVGLMARLLCFRETQKGQIFSPASLATSNIGFRCPRRAKRAEKKMRFSEFFAANPSYQTELLEREKNFGPSMSYQTELLQTKNRKSCQKIPNKLVSGPLNPLVRWRWWQWRCWCDVERRATVGRLEKRTS